MSWCSRAFWRILIPSSAALVLGGLVSAAHADPAATDDSAWLGANRSRVLTLFAHRVEAPELDDREGVSGELARSVGERLFFDRNVSGNGQLSCASCHRPELLWTDGRSKAVGIEKLAFNTPTLLGVSRQKWLFWDGRVIGLAHQALFPMNNLAEMATDPVKLADLIRSDAQYSEAYQQFFGQLPTNDCGSNEESPCAARRSEIVANTAKLIASFVAAIPSPETPFDIGLKALRNGEPARFTPIELRGMRVFVEKGNCVACHSGSDLSDGQFHNVLIAEAEGPGVFAEGRYGGISMSKRQMAATYQGNGAFDQFARQEIERARADTSTYAAFKTPTLRGLRCTAPYMHNGSYASLESVIDHYSHFADVLRPDHSDDPLLIPRDFSEGERAALVAFMLSVSPDLPACGGQSGTLE